MHKQVRRRACLYSLKTVPRHLGTSKEMGNNPRKAPLGDYAGKSTAPGGCTTSWLIHLPTSCSSFPFSQTLVLWDLLWDPAPGLEHWLWNWALEGSLRHSFIYPCLSHSWTFHLFLHSQLVGPALPGFPPGRKNWNWGMQSLCTGADGMNIELRVDARWSSAQLILSDPLHNLFHSWGSKNAWSQEPSQFTPACRKMLHKPGTCKVLYLFDITQIVRNLCFVLDVSLVTLGSTRTLSQEDYLLVMHVFVYFLIALPSNRI